MYKIIVVYETSFMNIKLNKKMFTYYLHVIQTCVNINELI